MKPLPAGIIEGFEWLKDSKTGIRYGMLDGKRLTILEVPKTILRIFLSEMMDDKEFMKANYSLSVPERFDKYLDMYYCSRFDEIPDLDLTTGKTNKELNLDMILTPREKEIIPYLTTGEKYTSIASKMNISINTFTKHLKDIYTKAHVHCVRDLLQLI